MWDQTEWLRKHSYTIVRYTLRYQADAWTAFFKGRAGYPKWKHRYSGPSFTYFRTCRYLDARCGLPRAIRRIRAAMAGPVELNQDGGSMVTDQALGRLIRVDLRDIRTREDNDFTSWLGRDKKKRVILGDSLGIDLELEAQEKAVGPFRADVLCKDTGTSVLIENQLERTDHRHLGQLLTMRPVWRRLRSSG